MRHERRCHVPGVYSVSSGHRPISCFCFGIERGNAYEPSEGKLAVPVTGSVVSVGGGTFEGTLALQRFAVRNGKPVAIGAISGSVQTDAGSRLTGVHALIELPVAISGAASAGLPGIQRQRGDALDGPTIRFVQATCVVAREQMGNTN